MPQVVRTIIVPQPPSVVWRQFASEDALRQWLAPTLSIDLVEGGSYRMRGADDSTWITGVVLEVVTEGRIVLSWMEEEAGWQHPGRLVIELRADRGGTLVTLTHDGFAGIGVPSWAATRDAYERGADRHHVLRRLAEVVGGA